MRRLSIAWTSSALAIGAGAAWIGAGCVDSADPTTPVTAGSTAKTDSGSPTSTSPTPPTPGPGADAGPDLCTDVPAVAPAAYGAWHNATILGGGFVSGIEFSRAQKNLIYARTDVGGAYRWDDPTQRWVAITDWVGPTNSNLMGIESIAPDPVDPNVVYVAAGEYLTTPGFILRSTDQTATWETPHAIGVPMGGNADGRNVGERLAIDPNLTSTLFFASRNTGLWTSTDSATTWTRVAGFTPVGPANYGLSFVFFDKRSTLPGGGSSTIYVGISPAATAQTGATLYRSRDGGVTWAQVGGDPAAGQFPMRASMDSAGHLYMTYGNFSGPNSVTAGTVWKLDTSNDTWTDATPLPRGKGGFGGVSVDPTNDANVIVSTIDRWPDWIYRTTNGATSWVPVVSTESPQSVTGPDWLAFGGSTATATGWMGDIEIDPFTPSRVLYNTGQGLWWTDDVTVASPSWNFQDHGLEETVALGLISPSNGGASLLSAVGDICGFRHTDLTQPSATGMFDNPVFGNTTSLDFAELHPSVIVRVGTNSATTATVRHGAYSLDEGISWTAFVTEPTQPTDGGTSTVSAGSIAISADGSTFVWAPTPATRRAAPPPAVSTHHGVTWTAITGLPSGAKVASDRVNPATFYATSGTELLTSTNGGVTFTVLATMPTANGTPRPTPGHEGDVWVSTTAGLYRVSALSPTVAPALIANVQSAAAVGFGRGAGCADYPILYLAGQVNSVSGILRSDDQGMTWQQIDDPQHQFGFISYITGDPRTYGRVYLGSGGRGILYGDP